MSPFKKLLAGVAVASLAAGGSYLSAQPDGDDTTPDIVVPMETVANLSPAEMSSVARETLKNMGEHQTSVEALKDEARKQKDVIKINCINDKLLQIKELFKIADTSQIELEAAIASADQAEAQHRYSMVVISGEKVQGLRTEAEACVGEEIDYLGPLDVNVDGPQVPDDPTQDDPFADDGIEPPGYASPFV
jgi:hypothetical protein